MNALYPGALYALPILTFLMAVGALATWFERRFSAQMQNRRGPVWVGPQGLLQVIADALKMMQKEEIVPRDADPVLYRLAPIFPVFLVLSTAAVLPFGGHFNAEGGWTTDLVIADLDVGVLWVLGLSGLMVFPLWMAGWSSNNKYALLAGMRAVAQGISYEIPMVVTAIVPVLLAGSLSLSEIVAWQAEHGWVVFQGFGMGFVAFSIFFLSSLAEANRIPFDIPEAESELVGGVIVEYTGMYGGLFLFAEYLHSYLAAAFAIVFFFGGAHLPGVALPGLLGATVGVLIFLSKTTALFVFIYWIRWSLFRFRADQLMSLCWRWFVPVSLFLLMGTTLLMSSGLA